MADEVKLGIEVPEGILFTLEDVSFSPASPMMNEPFTVKGKVNLLKIPFLGPVWVIATVKAPETWWEHYIPIWGSPEVRATDIALGGNFEITFSSGFDREGEYGLSVRVYPGPTVPLDSIVLPPAPAAATAETTFIVAGEAPPQEELFRNFSIASYSKNGGTPVTPPGVLELDIGDRCRVNLVYDHKGPAVSGKFHAAIWHKSVLDPHDEILYKEQSFSVPQSDDWETYEQSIDIVITSAISPGSDYGLYCKIIGITGGDVFTEFLENVITIVGAVEPQFGDLQITSYDSPLEIGDSCLIKVRFTYQGPVASRTLYAAIGNYGTFGFDEILKGSKAINIPESPVPTEYESDVSISITSAIDPAGSPYDLYTKIDGVLPDIESPVLQSVITVTGAVAQGSIVSKYINKSPEGSRIALPATVTADGNTFEVGVTAKNTSSAAYTGGVEVKVYDPSGTLRASPTVDYTGIDPGETLRWEYNICKVDKAGSWTIKIRFLARDGKVLDEEQATMTAKAVEYKGSIVSKYINKSPEGNRIVLPATVTADGNTFEVGVTAKNTSSAAYTGGVEVKVYDPSGTLRKSTTIDYTGIDPGETLRWEYNICKVDKAGSWTIKIRFLEKTTSAVLAEINTSMTATAVAVGISFKMTIWGIPSDFGSYDYWSCYYYDPGIGGFVSDYKWYSPSSRISFSDVMPGGYLAVILARGSVASNYYYSPSFTAVDGGIYQYDLQLNRISKIG